MKKNIWIIHQNAIIENNYKCVINEIHKKQNWAKSISQNLEIAGNKLNFSE